MATDTSNFNFQGIGVVSAFTIYGCTRPTSINYDPTATVDDGSCEGISEGCMDPTACNYNPTANYDTGDCEHCSCVNSVRVDGCMDPLACNYDPFANCDDGSCSGVLGCMDPLYYEYNASALATCDDNLCINLLGCTDPTASNYNPSATVDDPNNPCTACVYGCTDASDYGYDPSATCDDGSCIDSVYGCMDSTADNYDCATALNPNSPQMCADGVNTDDGSCVYTVYGCTDPTANNYINYPNTTTIISDNSCEYNGCTDITACNYDPTATFNDGSCWQPAANADCNGDCLSGFADDGSGNCITQVNGCTDCGTVWETFNSGLFCNGVSAAITQGAINYNPSATTNDGTCNYNYVYGCTDINALNYDSTAHINDATNPCLNCADNIIDVDITTNDITTLSWDPVMYTSLPVGNTGDITVTVAAGALDLPYTFVVTPDPTGTSGAFNHTATAGPEQLASINDSVTILSRPGSYTIVVTSANGCEFTDTFVVGTIPGCMDSVANNYNPNATTDDSSCNYACPALGTFIGGGWVFYTENIIGDTCNGLIASHEDAGAAGTTYEWGVDTRVVNASDYAIGKGQENTTNILNGNSCDNYGGGCDNSQPITAAAIASQHTTTVYGITYNDWYLPSGYELDEIAEVLSLTTSPTYALTASADGVYTDPNFAPYPTSDYWSSSQYVTGIQVSGCGGTCTEMEDAASVTMNFAPTFTGQGSYLTIANKQAYRHVRPIRSFTWDGTNGIS